MWAHDGDETSESTLLGKDEDFDLVLSSLSRRVHDLERYRLSKAPMTSMISECVSRKTVGGLLIEYGRVNLAFPCSLPDSLCVEDELAQMTASWLGY